MTVTDGRERLGNRKSDTGGTRCDDDASSVAHADPSFVAIVVDLRRICTASALPRSMRAAPDRKAPQMMPACSGMPGPGSSAGGA